MRTKGMVQICLLATLGLMPALAVVASQENSYGPEIKSFLDFMRHEDDELEFQIQHGEITRRDYVRAKNRHAIQRQTVLKIVTETGADIVPDLYVVTAAELSQLIEDGTRALRGVKRGDIIKNKWRYHGSLTKGEVFYIFERLAKT
jgi:hypothetical protein